MSASQAPRPPITDSPWFWLYLFGTAGIFAIMAQSVRYGDRQAQLDRQYQGRRHIREFPADQESAFEFSQADDKIRSLRPLYYVLGGVLIVGWIGLWWQRYRLRPLPSEPVETARDEAPP